MTQANVRDKLHFRQTGFSSIAYPINGDEGVLTIYLQNGFRGDNFLMEFICIAAEIKGTKKNNKLIRKNWPLL